ncbi:Leucine-rich repeat receptor-like kinase protein FLORAL ORGAN NUMBER1 [Bienertia sinuspersici]
MLKELNSLDLSLNSLSGSVPEKLFGIKTLQRIDLSGNRFSKEIPSSVSSLSSLVVFNVSNNKFSGSIPKKPKSLKNLNVGYNQLCDPIPSGLNRFSSKSFEHNKCLCGPPLANVCK